MDSRLKLLTSSDMYSSYRSLLIRSSRKRLIGMLVIVYNWLNSIPNRCHN